MTRYVAGGYYIKYRAQLETDLYAYRSIAKILLEYDETFILCISQVLLKPHSYNLY